MTTETDPAPQGASPDEGTPRTGSLAGYCGANAAYGVPSQGGAYGSVVRQAAPSTAVDADNHTQAGEV